MSRSYEEWKANTTKWQLHSREQQRPFWNQLLHFVNQSSVLLGATGSVKLWVYLFWSKQENICYDSKEQHFLVEQTVIENSCTLHGLGYGTELWCRACTLCLGCCKTSLPWSYKHGMLGLDQEHLTSGLCSVTRKNEKTEIKFFSLWFDWTIKSPKKYTCKNIT